MIFSMQTYSCMPTIPELRTTRQAGLGRNPFCTVRKLSDSPGSLFKLSSELLPIPASSHNRDIKALGQ